MNVLAGLAEGVLDAVLERADDRARDPFALALERYRSRGAPDEVAPPWRGGRARGADDERVAAVLRRLDRELLDGVLRYATARDEAPAAPGAGEPEAPAPRIEVVGAPRAMPSLELGPDGTWHVADGGAAARGRLEGAPPRVGRGSRYPSARRLRDVPVLAPHDAPERLALPPERARGPILRGQMTRAQRDDRLFLVLHELRNPLVGIDAAARVLAGELGDHPAARRAGSIAAEARHLLELLGSVSDAQAAETGRLRSFMRPTDLASLVREAVASVHADGHPLVLRGDDREIPVQADPQRLRQVLVNLLVNAAQYSAPGTPIEVVVGVGRGRATVTVRDRGRVIPAAERRRLFRKFARLSTADGTRGSGLGLYISRAIATDHGGELRYVAGGGNAFELRIPLRRAAARGGAASRPAARRARR